jgi:hypothetical protein
MKAIAFAFPVILVAIVIAAIPLVPIILLR